MSHWLQVLIPEEVDARISQAAQRGRMSVGEWVRCTIEDAPDPRASDAAAVRGDGTANLGATAACGITETARQEEEFINNEAREEEVSEKSLRAAAVPGGKGQ